MNCPNCGGKLYINQYQYHCNGCDRYYDVCYFHDRAEKAEGELKAIKARIEAVTITKLLATTFKEACIGCKYIGSGCGCIAIDNILGEATNRIIKQIGGEK
jgi:hypothetical protein